MKPDIAMDRDANEATATLIVDGWRLVGDSNAVQVAFDKFNEMRGRMNAAEASLTRLRVALEELNHMESRR